MSAMYKNEAGEIWSYKVMRHIGLDKDGNVTSELREYAVSDKSNHVVDLAPYCGDVTWASRTGILG